MKSIQLALTLAALSAIADLTTCPAQAAVIYDNGAVPNAGLASDAGGFVVRADDFILAPGASTITGVQWTGFYGSAIVHVDDDFTIQFFNSQSAGAPPPFETLEEPQDANLAIATIDVVNPNRTEAGGIFSYSASITPLALLPNTRYWVSIFNDASDEQTGWLWRGQTTTNNADIIAQRNQSNSWGNETARILDFQLIGEVPEPSTIGLLLVGTLAGCSGTLRNSTRRVS
jgi:hypothetical protein